MKNDILVSICNIITKFFILYFFICKFKGKLYYILCNTKFREQHNYDFFFLSDLIEFCVFNLRDIDRCTLIYIYIYVYRPVYLQFLKM